MNKYFNRVFITIGLMSVSQFAGAFDIILENTEAETPRINTEVLIIMPEGEQEVVVDLLDRLSSSSEEERRVIIDFLSERSGLIDQISTQPTELT
ncbi:MAG: hypothetical protein HON90_03420 [Halobacteriovoraceae bacterium]|mgnify:CR=1 FL=1|jgi:hypothetical protein|nr:hypothetical protein [Halobacteriovoraceae bacterium]